MKTLKSILFLAAVSVAFLPMFGLDLSYTLPIMAGLAGVAYFLPKQEGVLNSTLPVDVWDALNASIIRRNPDTKQIPSFLRSFFRVENTDSLNLLLGTKRGGRKVAVDTNIQTKSRMHKRQVGKLDIVQPPLYSYYTPLTLSDMYNGFSRLFFTDNLTVNDMSIVDDFGRVVANDLDEIADTIDMAKELQCAQLLSNGIVSLRNNDNIDFGRVGGSIVAAGSGKLWGASGAEYIKSITTGVDWIRSNAKNNSTSFHIIMGGDAFANFIGSTEVQGRQDMKNFQLDELFAGRPVPSGGTYWGTISLANGVRANIWSYDAKYELEDGTEKNFLDKDSVLMIPDQNQMVFNQSAVKYLPGTTNTGRYRSMYTRDHMDNKEQVHFYFLEDRFLAVTQEINEVYTLLTQTT